MAVLQVKKLKCPVCAAPLSIPPGAHDVRCEYCGGSIHVERKAAPRDFTAEQAAQQRVVYVRNGAPRAVVLGIGFAGLILAMVAALAVWLVGSKADGPLAALAAPDGHCEHETRTVRGVAKKGEGPLFTAGLGCRLTLENVQLEATSGPAVKALVGAEVRVTGAQSALRGETSAVELGTNAKLHVGDGARLWGGEQAVLGEVNAEVEVNGGVIEGEDAGLRLGTNGKVTLSRAEVSGKRRGAIVAETNLKLSAKDSTLKGGVQGVEARVNAQLTFRQTQVTGAQAAVKVDGNARLALLKGAKLTSEETAVSAGGNLELEAEEDAEVGGGRVGLEAKGNAKVTLAGASRVHGERAGVKLEGNAEVRMTGGRIESAGTALEVGTNAVLHLRGGALSGGQYAIVAERRPRTLEREGVTVEGEEELDRQRAPKRGQAGR